MVWMYTNKMLENSQVITIITHLLITDTTSRFKNIRIVLVNHIGYWNLNIEISSDLSYQKYQIHRTDNILYITYHES